MGEPETMTTPTIEELAARIKKNPYSFPLAEREPEDPDIKDLRLNDPAGYEKLLALWVERRRMVNSGTLP